MSKISLNGVTSLATLIQVLEEIASFCGEDSQIKLENVPIQLGIQSFIDDPAEQQKVIEEMLKVLAKYHVQVSLQ